MKNDVKYSLYAAGALVLLGGGYVLWKKTAPVAHPLAPPPMPPVMPPPRPPPPPSAPASFYASEADRQQRIADATIAVQSGDPNKIKAALARLSQADRKKLEDMLPSL